MTHEFKTQTEANKAMVYHITIKGHLDGQWSGWFDGLAISPLENGETLLSGPVVDQAALYGLLRKVRDMGLPLLSVHYVSSSESETSQVNR